MTHATEATEAQVSAPVKIVVLQRGWVVVGRYAQDGDVCTLADAAVVRN